METAARHWYDVTVEIDYARCQQGHFRIKVRGSIEHVGLSMHVPLLAVDGQGIHLTVDGAQRTSDHKLLVTGSDFKFTIDLHTSIDTCVGADVDIEIVYPFANASEAFLGTGFIPIPTEARPHDNVRIKAVNLPRDWSLVSNGLHVGVHDWADISNYFFYAAAAMTHTTYSEMWHDIEPIKIYAQQGIVDVQQMRAMLKPAVRLLRQIELRCDIGNPHLNGLTVLLLQAPPDFRERVPRSVFATGENVPAGIVIYAPNDPPMFERFGVRDYHDFLTDGMVHEFMHMWCSSSDDAWRKSFISMGPELPPHLRHFFGEALPGYIHRQFYYTHIRQQPDLFFTEQVPLWQAMAAGRQRPSPHLHWLRLEAWARSVNPHFRASDIICALLGSKRGPDWSFEDAMIVSLEMAVRRLTASIGYEIPVAWRNRLHGHELSATDEDTLHIRFNLNE